MRLCAAVFPADLNAFLIMWQEFVRVRRNRAECDVEGLVNLCVCCIIYSLKQCHRAVDYGEVRVAVRAPREQETGGSVRF